MNFLLNILHLKTISVNILHWEKEETSAYTKYCYLFR